MRTNKTDFAVLITSVLIPPAAPSCMISRKSCIAAGFRELSFAGSLLKISNTAIG